MTRSITALVVTYNRRILLERCLAAVAAQSCPPARILVVDNASTDDTRAWLAASGWLARADVELLALDDNTGGAGGFAAGIAHAVATGADWVWLMDDDAEPHVEALQRLAAAATEPADLYGSVAVSGERLAWMMMPQAGGGRRTLVATADLPATPVDVSFIPFLGLLVSRELVARIGIPDARFFLAADDVEYCFRARAAGARIQLVPDSRIEHPAADRYAIRLPGRTFHSLRLVPWKRYYDVRNRLFVARRHYGAALWYQTIPGQFLRLAMTLVHEPDRLRQLHAFVAGMVDGLRGRGGRRHEAWGIRP
ncbi:MAG: glycosyltransferase [Gammaproteobacteria bacterium]|nr:glycosyltransferase [Gammaproteobacteria bacterium]MCP5199538.1 glycosyltransferase [Gammaproteobacteria bacterium]